MPDITDIREYTVAGMTCSDCVRSVRDEVTVLPAVSGVDVDLASGRLTVTGAVLDDAEVRAAVAEAGTRSSRKIHGSSRSYSRRPRPHRSRTRR